jgi:hypothetical protein
MYSTTTHQHRSPNFSDLLIAFFDVAPKACQVLGIGVPLDILGAEGLGPQNGLGEFNPVTACLVSRRKELNHNESLTASSSGLIPS